MQELKPNKATCSSVSKVIGLVRQGDSGAFELIYRSYYGLVYRICLRMLRDPSEAEDAAQDVFIRVVHKIHTFRGDSAFSSWLYRLTTNLVLMRFRKNKHACASVCELIDEDSVLSSETRRADVHLSALSGAIDLQAAINLLPDGYKATFLLHEVQGYDHQEIAEMFGYSIGNSKSQLHKARKRLRKLLCVGEEVSRNAGMAQVGNGSV